MTYDVLVYGPVFCDLIFTDLPSMPMLGREIYARNLTIAVGGSAIVAVALHRLGARVGLIAELGSDALSQVTKGLLADMGLDLALIREHPTPLPQVTVALSFPEDRAFVTRFDRPSSPPDLSRILHESAAKHLHLCSFLAVLDQPNAAHLAHQNNMTISMDPGWDEEGLHNSRFLEIIPDLDIFLPSQSEACYIAQTESTETAIQRLAPDNGLIVVKNGKEGAIAYSGSHQESIVSLPVDAIDTTGAGDSFDAGFIYAYVQGKPLRDCLRFGAICGALATTAPGGATATPTNKEVQQWLPKLP